MNKIALSLLICCFHFSLSAQEMKELQANSIKCYNRKNYDCFLKFVKKIDSLKPMNLTNTYNLACAYALTGNSDKAFTTLEKSILMNSKSDFENDADLASLKTLPGYDQMLKIKAEAEKEIKTSTKNVSLSEKDLHPEGLLYLKKSKTWLATSIRNSKIVCFDMKTGKCKDWLNPHNIFSVFAMKADAAEKYLWVATSAVDVMSGYTPNLDGKAEILKIDIKTKEVVQRFKTLGRHVFGDLLVAKNGAVYISDSFGASIYKIEGDEIVHWVTVSGTAFNFQGMTFNGDETKLYIADYFSGILEIPIDNAKNHKWLAFPKGTITKGIDGLSWHKNSLIAIHNGVKPIRIMQYFLDASGENIIGFKVIDNNRSEFDEPALGFIKDNRFYYFANCPWNAYDKANNLDDSKFENPKVFSFALE